MFLCKLLLFRGTKLFLAIYGLSLSSNSYAVPGKFVFIERNEHRVLSRICQVLFDVRILFLPGANICLYANKILCKYLILCYELAFSAQSCVLSLFNDVELAFTNTKERILCILYLFTMFDVKKLQ